MGEHLSALALDTLAAELPVDLPTSGHVATCAACRSKLEALKAERAAVMQAPRFKTLLAQLEPAAPPRRTLPRWAPVLLAMAAALLVIVGTRLLPKEDDTILKGHQTVELLKGDGPVVTARVGDRLELAVGGAGKKDVAVFAVDEKKEVSVLVASRPLAAGPRVRLSLLEVTAGSLTVFACFSDHPLPMDSLRAEILASAASPPEGCVTTKLEVLP